MEIDGAVALVTGANRGIGHAFAMALLDRGAKKVYAAVRDPSSITDPRLTPLRLDVAEPEEAQAAAERAVDVDIVINNAGASSWVPLLDGDLDQAYIDMRVNFFGTWAVARAFAPVLARNGGGALVNMLSTAAWRQSARMPAYAASKAAQWALTNSLRLGLNGQGTLVTGVFCAYVDTQGSARIDAPKISPELVAEKTMDGIARNEPEVLVDDFAKQVKAGMSDDMKRFYEHVLRNV